MLRVVEIFDSIEGEGIRAGEFSTFIRLAGCNLRCSYCDTGYALPASSGHDMDISEVMQAVGEAKNRNVTLTGGEPLLQAESLDLVRELIRRGHHVNIETNGSMDVVPYLDIENCYLTVDYKSKSSGEQDKMRVNNFKSLRPYDVLKCVVAESDLDDIERVIHGNAGNAWVYLSPVYGKIQPVQIVDKMKVLKAKGYDMRKVRLQVQLHKIVWDPETRGV